MRLSYVIITHNRRETLCRTLQRLPAGTPVEHGQWEVVVVDNASTDGTAGAIDGMLGNLRVLRRIHNTGCAARNVGVDVAAGEVVVFLDDDSWPMPGAIDAALAALERRPRLGVLGGPVHLTGGGEDAAALPLVPPACGMVVRRSAFQSVGGFCSVFIRQAEEYDLVFRFVAAGWEVDRLADVRFEHEKTPAARCPAAILELDLRNNLLLAGRYLPPALRRPLRRDWLRRYAALLRHGGHDQAVTTALADARRLAPRERGRYPQLDAKAIEQLFGLDRQARAVKLWSRTHDARRVAIVDHSKTTWITWQACRRAGLGIAAVADGHPAYAGQHYRGAPIRPLGDVLGDVDGLVLSNLNPAQQPARLAALREQTDRPILAFPHPDASAARLSAVA